MFLPPFGVDGGFYLAVFVASFALDAAGASNAQVGAALGIYNLVYGGLAAWLGAASDRRPVRWLGSASAAFLCVSIALALTVRDPRGGGAGLAWWIYGSMAAYGVANALFWPSFQARLGDRAGGDPEVLARSVRVFNVGWTAGKAGGFLAGGALIVWAPAAALWVVVGLAACVVLGIWIDPRRAAPREASTATSPGRGRRGFLVAGLALNFAVWGALATLKGLAPKLRRTLDLSEWEIGLVLFVALAAQGLRFASLGTAWAYRRGPLLRVIPLAGLGLGLIAAGGSVWAVLVGAALLGQCQAVTYAASVYYSLDYDERRGLRAGVHEATLAVGGVAPIVGGLLADTTGLGLAPLLWSGGVLALASGIALRSLWAEPA